MRRDYVKYILALLLFGSNGVVSSYIDLNSYEIVFFRTLIGGLFLVAAFLLSRGKFQAIRDRRRFIYLFLSGMAMGANWMFLYEGYRQIGVGLATLASYFGPVIVMALSPLVFRERLKATKVLGILAAFCGMVLVDFDALADSGLSWGLACGFFAAVMYAVLILCNKKAAGVTGLENALWQLVGAFVVVSVFLVCREGFSISVPRASILPILLLGVVNTGVGCYLYFSGVGGLPAQSVAICGYLEPLSTLVFSTLCLQEQLSLIQMVGAVLILGGAAFGECWGHRKREAACRS